MRDIWGLQTRFHYRAGKRAAAVLGHEKFRAGYDFLCIRAQAGETVANGDLKQDCQWWTELQKQNPDQQKNTLISGAAKPKSGKTRRRRRSPAKKTAKPAEKK